MNKKIKILFLHGKEGSPEGSKITFLKNKGFRVIAPVLPKDNWNLSVARAIDTFNNFQPDLVIGSSRGGAIASAINTKDIPKILIAPAWKKFEVLEPFVETTTTILHCPSDNIVPYQDSVELERILKCNLITCGQGHRMSDEHALSELLKIVKIFNNADR